MSEHTSGPYRVEEESSTEKGATTFVLYAGSVYLGYLNEGSDDPALIVRGWLPLAVARANANLFVAAPDLLAACQECLKVVDEAYEATGFFKVAKTSDERMRLEAAIAKATKGQA